MVREELVLYIILSIALSSLALKCYQCKSYSERKNPKITTTITPSVTTEGTHNMEGNKDEGLKREELKPKCDPHYWRKLNRTARRMMESHCPRGKSSFCLKEVKYFENGTVYTARGCVGDHDGGGLPVGYGCLFEDPNSTCTCDTDICNMASSTAPLLSLVLFLSLKYLFNK